MNKFLKIVLWMIVIAAITVALGFVNKNHKKLIINKPIVEIDYETDNRFIDEQDVLREIIDRNDSSHFLLAQFDVKILEEKLQKNSSIKEVQVYKTIDGQLMIDVKQRRPIIRVFSKNDNYYIDEKGKLMMCSKKYTSRLPIVSGFINEPYQKRYQYSYSTLPDSIANQTLLDDIYELSTYIDKSPFWKAQIEQILVNKELEFEFIPKVGNHKIVFGGVDNINSKFEKLMLFYQKGLNKTGWNEYSVINLTYKNQVVCTKRYIE